MEKSRRVGLLMGGSERGPEPVSEAFRKGLRDLGYVDGQSIALEYRYANDRYDRLPALAAALIHLNVSVIVANGTPASLAAKQATSIISIVMFETADPVGSELVSGLAKPGGNVTGVAQLVRAALNSTQAAAEVLGITVPPMSADSASSSPSFSPPTAGGSSSLTAKRR